MNKQIFTDRLKYIRKLRGLTGKELSILCNIPASAISHFESGRRLPSFKNLLRLSDALVINIDFLLGRTADKHCAGIHWQKLYAALKNVTLEDIGVLAAFSEKLARSNLQKNSCHIEK